MIYEILGGGILLALVVLVLVALEVRATGYYVRTFNASNGKVWHVWNDADSIKQWWGRGVTPPHSSGMIFEWAGRICGQ